jgi:hypothetical protein
MVYMIIESGSNSPVNITSLRFVEDFKPFINRLHIEYINRCLNWRRDNPGESIQEVYHGFYLRSFERFLNCQNFRIYECKETKINPKTGKSKRPKDLNKKRNFLAEQAKILGFNLEEGTND